MYNRGFASLCLSAFTYKRFESDTILHFDVAELIFVLQLIFVKAFYMCGPGSSVGIATELRVRWSGIESRWGRDFASVQTGHGGPT